MDEFGNPSDVQLLEWAQEHGIKCDAFLEDCFEQADLPVTYTSVPYGDTFAHFADGPTPDDLTESVLLSVAEAWWGDERIDWGEGETIVLVKAAKSA